MSNKTEIKQPALAPQKKECRECKREINIKANKCHHCGSYQKKWQSWLVNLPYGISLVMMIIAITQTSLSFRQVELTKKDLSDASKALQEIEKMKTIVDLVVIGVHQSEKNISTLEKNINEKTENVEQKIAALQEAMDSAALQTSKSLPFREESKLTYFKHSVEKVPDGIQIIISFNSSANLPLGAVEFSIEIESKPDAKILSISPAETIAFAVRSTIEKNMRKGYLSYVSSGSTSPKIQITLSAPAKLIIQGKPALSAFTLDIK